MKKETSKPLKKAMNRSGEVKKILKLVIPTLMGITILREWECHSNSFFSSASESTGMLSVCALVSLDPASSPATT